VPPERLADQVIRCKQPRTDERIRQPVQNRESGEWYQRIPNGKGGSRHVGRLAVSYNGSVEPACAPIGGRVYQGDYTSSPRKKVGLMSHIYSKFSIFKKV
jgi:hypothetical protein